MGCGKKVEKQVKRSAGDIVRVGATVATGGLSDVYAVGTGGGPLGGASHLADPLDVAGSRANAQAQAQAQAAQAAAAAQAEADRQAAEAEAARQAEIIRKQEVAAAKKAEKIAKAEAKQEEIKTERKKRLAKNELLFGSEKGLTSPAKGELLG